MRALRFLLPLLALAAAPVPAANTAPYEALRGLDARLAAIAYRLTTANAPLCRDLEPATGIVLHAIDQYPAGDAATVRAAFGFPAPVSVELVVPGSPGALAGVRAGEGVTAIDGAAVAPPVAKPGTSATRDAAIAQVQRASADAPLSLDLVDAAAAPHRVTVHPRPGCRVAVEVVAGRELGASSDGRVVQVAAPLMAKFGDEDVAVVVAHELAHAILRHRARLEAAGVHWGIAGEFGRNARLFRQTETEADLLGAILLRNAGWDPQEAVRFWRGPGDKIDGGFFRSRTHPSASDRAKAIEDALAAIPADAPAVYVPPLLAARDEALQ